jgi:DNA helicase-2/ATP-dependent DNA helicase PcrA
MNPVGDTVFHVIEHSGLHDYFKKTASKDPLATERIENLSALVDHAYEYQTMHPENDIAAFLEEVALVSDIDEHDAGADSLSLMTLHSSKGLEFDAVFIVGAEEAYLPVRSAIGDAKKVEEERRLFYVGITRARQQVVVSHAHTRYMWGEVEYRLPSRFLDELPADGLVRLEDGTPW